MPVPVAWLGPLRRTTVRSPFPQRRRARLEAPSPHSSGRIVCPRIFCPSAIRSRFSNRQCPLCQLKGRRLPMIFFAGQCRLLVSETVQTAADVPARSGCGGLSLLPVCRRRHGRASLLEAPSNLNLKVTCSGPGSRYVGGRPSHRGVLRLQQVETSKFKVPRPSALLRSLQVKLNLSRPFR